MTGLHWLGATMRLLKLLEVPKLLRGNYGKWWDLLKVRYSVNSYVALTARFFSILVLVNHWCACVWLALGWMPAEGLPTWSRVLRQEAIAGTSSYDDSKEFEAYFTSWYWALTTMSTIGYGDVSPTNVLERVFACLVMLFGNVVFAYGITNVVTAIANSDRASRDFEQRLDYLNTYVEQIRDWVTPQTPHLTPHIPPSIGTWSRCASRPTSAASSAATSSSSARRRCCSRTSAGCSRGCRPSSDLACSAEARRRPRRSPRPSAAACAVFAQFCGSAGGRRAARRPPRPHRRPSASVCAASRQF